MRTRSGKRIAFTGDVLKFTPISADWRTIVGVVGNTRDGGQDAAPRAVAFMPFAQELAMLGGSSSAQTAMRRDSRRPRLASCDRIAPTVPIEHVLTVAQIKDESVSPRRLNAALVSSFGTPGGDHRGRGDRRRARVLGERAHERDRHPHESRGGRGRVQRMILREGGVLLAIGLALGVVGAFFAARIIRGLLFGVAPSDPATLIGVAAMMAAIGIGACWVPALRAARIDPAISMRS